MNQLLAIRTMRRLPLAGKRKLATTARQRFWIALALANCAWDLLWAQALYDFHLLPQALLSILFFAGLGFGARELRRDPALLSPPKMRSGSRP